MRLFRSLTTLQILKSSTLQMIPVLALVLFCGSKFAQGQAAQNKSVASIHGHVQDPLQVPVGNAMVKLTTDSGNIDKGSHFPYSFPTDATGDYKGTGITPGVYHVVVFQGDKTLDYQEKVTFEAGVDTKVDFDMSRQEYIDKMTPADRKTYEEYKKKNAAANVDNAQVKNLNALLQQARDEMDPSKTHPPAFDKAAELMRQATTARPLEPVLWFELGHADIGLKKYDQAAVALQKSIDLNNESKKVSPATAGAAYNELGEAQANLGKVTDASKSYEAAAKANPPSAGMYYSNEAITLYKAGETDFTNQAADYTGAIAAADKATAADPKSAISYYVKGQALVGQSTQDPKTQKMVAPPGCLEAYEKYLQIDPNGQFAPEVKSILSGFDQALVTGFKAKK